MRARLLLFSIINASISLAEDLISRKNLQMPGTITRFSTSWRKPCHLPRPLRGHEAAGKTAEHHSAEYDSFDEKQVRKLGRK